MEQRIFKQDVCLKKHDILIISNSLVSVLNLTVLYLAKSLTIIQQKFIRTNDMKSIFI